MVIVFPMLVSQSVSENVIPGIAKTIESYIIVNHMSDIMDQPEIKKSGLMKGFRSVGKKRWIAKEGVLVLGEDSRDDIMPPGSGTKGKTQIDPAGAKRQTAQDAVNSKKERDRKKDEREERSAQRKEEEYQKKKADEEAKQRETKATAKITTSDYKSISLEPSYVTVEITTRSGAVKKEFVGIKVVPYRVKSSEKLSRLILHDVQLGKLNASMVSFGRKILRWIYTNLDKWTSRLKIGSVTMSGDPRRDVIMNRTGKKGLGIIILSRNEDIDERFLNNIGRINRLFKMGWGNIVVADDVSRNAYFCMRGFGGACQVINYAMMYQNLGQLKVYDSLEDAHRQNSSLFKVSVRAGKVFSEWKTEQKLLKYYISEDK